MIWVRLLCALVMVWALTACAPADRAGADRASVSLQTRHFTISYAINADDQVTESFRYNPSSLDPGDTVVLAERRYKAGGAYAALVTNSAWPRLAQDAPQKLRNYSGVGYHAASRQPYTLPTLTLRYIQGPISTGTLVSVKLPIPTRDDPANGLQRAWAQEREWAGQKVGQFLASVGLPRLMPEAYLDDISPRHLGDMPENLNLNSYQ